MSLSSHTSRFFILICTLCLPAIASVPTPPIASTKIRLDERSMVLVPVHINGSGPYQFLLDTGATRTMVDQKLADQLHLPTVGAKTLVGVLASAKLTTVHATTVSIVGATASDLDLFSTDHSATVTANVRGVLGEDFLQNFDLLIDYRHQVLRIDSPLGSMATSASGERLPLQLTGTYHGQPTHNRLVLSARIYEFGGAPMSLLLDSGANSLTLFRDTLGAEAHQQEPILTGNFNKWTASSTSTRTVRLLYLGTSAFTNLTAIAVSRRADADTDGLVPTSLFDSIFLSPRGRFAILNPSFPRPAR